MELQLRSAEINLPQEIANLEALKAELAPKLEYYNNLVVTEDSIKAAKNDKANLNKLRTAIEDQRKAAKKQYLAPYEILEAQCKEVTALIDAPIAAIDKQLKVFEEIEKNDKFTSLSAAFTEFNAPDWIDINDVLNPKWENKTQKLDALKAEMKANYDKILSDYAQLEKLYENFPHLIAILNRYKTEKDFSQTMVYAKKLEFDYNREQELKAKLLEAAQEAAAEESGDVAPEPEQTAAPVEPEQAPKIIVGRFEVAGTAEQIKALGQYMKANNIKFTIIKEG